MTNEPVPATAEQPISARGWVKLILTLVIGTAAILLTIQVTGSTPGDVAAYAYEDASNHVMEEGGGNPLVAHGEGQIAAMIWLMMALCMFYGASALVVQTVVNAVWHTSPRGPVRDIIRVRGS